MAACSELVMSDFLDGRVIVDDGHHQQVATTASYVLWGKATAVAGLDDGLADIVVLWASMKC